jgi:UDP-N-acetylglucosamine 2-epimerase (non-hydrolysing)
MRILTIAGTRPEIIRLSATIKKLDMYFEHRFIHTGQNSSKNMRDVFFEDLDLRQPDAYWDIESGHGLSNTLGAIMVKLEAEIRTFKPTALVVLGDTNSALATVIARRMGVVIYHIEAGNRSFDENVPEEINRRIIDHFANFNLAYSKNALQNLLDEGLDRRRIATCGSPMLEVIKSIEHKLDRCSVLEDLGLEAESYILVSAHRQENVNSSERLFELLQTLGKISEFHQKRVLVSLHPRTRDKLNDITNLIPANIEFHEPFGFIDYLRLQMSAFVVLSDSGTISEESSILNFPAISIRDSMERQEALDTGSMMLSGIDLDNVMRGIEIVKSRIGTRVPEAYKELNHSEIVVRFISSTASRANDWMGIRN